MIDESMSGLRIESGRTRGDNKEDGDGRMDKETESGRILVELREIRKMMEDLVNVMRKVTNGLERREEQVSKRSEVRRKEKGTEVQENRVEGERTIKEEGREQEERRKMEESKIGKRIMVERRKKEREEEGESVRGRDKNEG